MKILHVVDTLETGGLERGVVNLIQRMDPRRFQHSICAIRNLGPLAAQIPADRVSVACLNKAAGYSSQVLPLARLIRKIRPDVVHSRNWGTIEAVVAARWLRSCALVHSEHGMESAGNSAEPRHKRWLRRLAFEMVDKVVSVSRDLRDYYSRRTGFPASRIEVIPNGVDTARFRPRPGERERLRQKFGMNAGELCIGAVGRLEPVKSHITLLQAMCSMPQKPDWRVLIAGDGSQMEPLRQFAKENSNLAGRVNFVGEITEIPEFLSALDVYVLPSLSEGISNSLLEAMASGLPVIASETGGNPEIVVSGESGLLFPVGDWQALAAHVLLLQKSPEKRSRFAEGAARRIADFSIDAMVRRYERLYEGLGELNRKWV